MEKGRLQSGGPVGSLGVIFGVIWVRPLLLANTGQSASQ
jgi:hypothetical protein